MANQLSNNTIAMNLTIILDSKTNIAKITLPVPTIPEQTAIAEILSDMDAEIAALKAKLAKIRHGYGCDCGDHR